jgi:hypothetical protein
VKYTEEAEEVDGRADDKVDNKEEEMVEERWRRRGRRRRWCEADNQGRGGGQQRRPNVSSTVTLMISRRWQSAQHLSHKVGNAVMSMSAGG